MTDKNKPNKWKEIIKSCSYSFFGGCVAILLLVLVVVVVTKVSFSAFLTGGYGEMQSNVGSQEKLVKGIAGMCDKKEDMDKVYCVNTIVGTLMTYNETNDEIWTGFTLPTQFLNGTGDCYNSAVAYCSIFKDMGIDCVITGFDETKQGGSHAFAIIRYNKIICIADQSVLKCW